MLKQLGREQAALQLLFQRNDEFIEIVKENEMLKGKLRASEAEIKDLQEKLVPIKELTEIRDM